MIYPEYDSPIELIVDEMSKQVADQVDDMTAKALIKFTQRMGIDVDKDKMLDILYADQRRYRDAYRKGYETAESVLYTGNKVAEILAEVIGDECACNVNGNDEWLPEYCDFRDTCCPYPGGVACWEQYLKYRDKRPKEG